MSTVAKSKVKPAAHAVKTAALQKTKRVSTGNRPMSDRLNCRIRAEVKARAEEAARLTGLSITAFTEAALNERAQKVFEQHERLAFSQRDFTRVQELLASPPAPTKSLIAAMREYDKQKSGQPAGNW
jgi:uncharacterized protein (DUF1778 family)